MYADLMELNGRLHRSLADKDVTICSLVRLLREAGIEVRGYVIIEMIVPCTMLCRSP